MFLTFCWTGLAFGQAPNAVERPQTIANPSFEEADEQGRPSSWSFVSRPQGGPQSASLSTDSTDGLHSVVIDATAPSNEFTNLMQAIDATQWQGQRVRLRAATRVAEVGSQASVQMWFRVDTSTGMGAFDNMQDRPIRASDWQDFDIVLDVADNATLLNVGIFVIGSGKAWVDDVRLEVVDEEVDATGASPSGFAAALAATSQAPPQPFWTPWLLLAIAALLLFVLSQLGSVGAEHEGAGPQPFASVVRFAFRFSLLYWLLYSLPQPFGRLMPSFLDWLPQRYGEARDAVVRWTGANVLGFEGEMFSPNGSGDTTYAYVSLLVCFFGALGGALVWSTIDRKRRDLTISNDLLRSYLRYVLAATMIGYGLAKVGFIRNQFSPPSEFQLNRTYGDSSPMGLLWTFMGASRVYTFFGGLGELVGGLLLLWRRTTTLGALVVIAVMTNVVMLNFSYDVPVKQYSVHLLVMALVLLLPELKRLSSVLLFNRPTDDRDLDPPYVTPASSPRVRWSYRAAKCVLVLFVGLVPVVTHVWNEVKHARSSTATESEAVQGDATESEEPLLMRRGFRWISEAPFNR